MRFLKLTMASLIMGTSVYAADMVFAIGEWPPYTGETEIEYGTTTKRVKEICEKAGLECSFEFMPWKRAFNMAQKGRVAGTFPWEADPSYEESFILSPKVTATEVVAFSTKDIPAGLKSDYTQFNAMKLVGVNGYTFPETLKKDGVKIHMVNESKLAWRMLKGGKAHTYVDDKAVGEVECKAYAADICGNLKVSEPLLSSDMSVLFTRVGDERVSGNIQKFIAAMK